jgi:magnesium chelatase family protein
VTSADLTLPPPSEGTSEVAARVAAARNLAAARAEGAGNKAVPLNARADGEWLETIAALDQTGRSLLVKAAEAGGISARGWTRTLRLARTIADLDHSPNVRRVHVAEALIYRRAMPGGGEVSPRATPLSWRGVIGARV